PILAQEAAANDTVVPFRAAAGEGGPVLSAVEHSAFRELSRKLSQRLSAAGIAHQRTEGLAAHDEGDAGNRDAAIPHSTDAILESEPAHALIAAATARERAQLALARAEIAELQSILDTATDGVVILDGRGRVSAANRSAQALFGYDAGEFSARAFA